MGISESNAKVTKKIVFAIGRGIAKGLINEGFKKIGAGEVASEVYGNVIDAVSDSADNNMSWWLEKLYEGKNISKKIDQIYKSEIDDLINANKAYSEMPSLVEFASSKSDTAIFKDDIINCIDEWRNSITKETRSTPNISNQEISTFLDKLYHNIEFKMAIDSDLQIFWNVLRNIRKSEEILETLNELKEEGKSSNDMLNVLYNKQEYIKDNTDEYFKNYYSPLCIHRGEVENIVTLKDVFVMPDVKIECETESLDNAVRDFIRKDVHEAMLLIGNGGFGKTSFVSYMAANKYYFCKNRPLHIIRLREYSKSSIDRLCDDIADSDKRRKISKDAVIVFDGLDELCMITVGNDEDKAAKIIDKLVKQFYAYAGVDKRKIIITSRPGFVNQGDTIKDIEIGFESVNLLQANYCSFDKTKIEKFIEKIEKADTRLTEADKKAGCDYIKNTMEHNSISDIYSSPFILYLICCVQIKNIEIEPSKLDNSWYLFRKIFLDHYMNSPYKDRNYNPEMEDTIFSKNREQIYEKTCEFAFEMYKKGLGKDDVIRLDNNDKDLEGFKECYALSCYFNKKSDGVIEFSHNYIRDFFVCEYILKELNKVIGEGEFTEEKGEEVANWCSENLLYNSLYATAIIGFIRSQFITSDNTYDFGNINEENIHYIFDCFVANGGITARVLKNAKLYKSYFYNEELVSNIFGNSQSIFVLNLRIRGIYNSIKLISKYEVSNALLNKMVLYGVDLSCINLKKYNDEGQIYNSKTIFPVNFDPQAHGMVYGIRRDELKEKLGNIPPLIRRQMRLYFPATDDYDENVGYHINIESRFHKYDPIRNEIIGIDEVCMTPDERDSIININTVCEGETISFGNYEWIILKTDIKTRTMLVYCKLLITLPGIYCDFDEVPWERSAIRKWLNNEFIKEFSNLEREHIIETNVDGVDDKIFILSNQEYNDYINVLGLMNFELYSRNPFGLMNFELYSRNALQEFVGYQNFYPALWLKF